MRPKNYSKKETMLNYKIGAKGLEAINNNNNNNNNKASEPSLENHEPIRFSLFFYLLKNFVIQRREAFISRKQKHLKSSKNTINKYIQMDNQKLIK
jgi:hypothetical protein